MIRRNEAKMIAEELYALIRTDCMRFTKEYMDTTHEEYLNIKEAAKILGWSVFTLYRNKKLIGSYTKVGKELRFPKSHLLKMISEGRLKSPNVK